MDGASEFRTWRAPGCPYTVEYSARVLDDIRLAVEEAFFRGFLQPRFGLVVSSILFALSHFNYGLPFLIVGVFTISLVIGLTLTRSGDLLPCIIAHGIFDSVQLFIVLPWVVRLWSTAPPPS